MILRFFLYSVLKNLRFADPFLILFFLDSGLTYSEIGVLLGLQHLATVLLEFPSGVLADSWGRRRATALCFAFYSVSFAGLGATDLRPSVSLRLWLGACLGLFALGEAFRTGSHKAIMLDYLDSTGQSDLATRLIGRTRAVSKYTSATAALCGGLLLSWSREYALLFFLSAGAAVCGGLLMLTYPRELEGNAYRKRRQGNSESDGIEERPAHEMWRRPSFRTLFVQSILFESQTKLVLKYFTQPFLKAALGSFGLPIIAPAGAAGLVSAGAFWVGLSEFLRDSLGGLGARISPRFEQFAGSPHSALTWAYRGGFLAVLGLAACTSDLKGGLIPGLLILTLLTALQNLRRPIFLSTLNTEMVKTQRASILSLESVSRAVIVAVLLPLFGWAADHFGLVAVWMLSSAILLAGIAIKFGGESVPVPRPAEEAGS